MFHVLLTEDGGGHTSGAEWQPETGAQLFPAPQQTGNWHKVYQQYT